MFSPLGFTFTDLVAAITLVGVTHRSRAAGSGSSMHSHAVISALGMGLLTESDVRNAAAKGADEGAVMAILDSVIAEREVLQETIQQQEQGGQQEEQKEQEGPGTKASLAGGAEWGAMGLNSKRTGQAGIEKAGPIGEGVEGEAFGTSSWVNSPSSAPQNATGSLLGEGGVNNVTVVRAASGRLSFQLPVTSATLLQDPPAGAADMTGVTSGAAPFTSAATAGGQQVGSSNGSGPRLPPTGPNMPRSSSSPSVSVLGTGSGAGSFRAVGMAGAPVRQGSGFSDTWERAVRRAGLAGAGRPGFHGSQSAGRLMSLTGK